MTKIKVAINGYGTIGKRVAEAVSKQDDMEVIGITKTTMNYDLEIALEKGYNLYTNNSENFKGVEVKGTIEDLVKQADIIIDCTPEKTGETYKPLYEKYRKKAIFQGGEKKNIGESFVAQMNYNDILGKDYVRVVSCNTTGLCRTIGALYKKYNIKHVEAQLIRRGADPKDSKKGPITQIAPVIKKGDLPHGHHGPDIKTVIKDLDIHTMALAVPSSIMHLHCIQVELEETVTKEEIIELLKNTTRIKMIKYEAGFKSTGDIMEYARELERSRNDLFEIAVWEDSIYVEKCNRVSWYQAVHQESDVIPENIDAIRAMFSLMSAKESIKKTNETLGIK